MQWTFGAFVGKISPNYSSWHVIFHRNSWGFFPVGFWMWIQTVKIERKSSFKRKLIINIFFWWQWSEILILVQNRCRMSRLLEIRSNKLFFCFQAISFISELWLVPIRGIWKGKRKINGTNKRLPYEIVHHFRFERNKSSTKKKVEMK